MNLNGVTILSNISATYNSPYGVRILNQEDVIMRDSNITGTKIQITALSLSNLDIINHYL